MAFDQFLRTGYLRQQTPPTRLLKAPWVALSGHTERLIT